MTPEGRKVFSVVFLRHCRRDDGKMEEPHIRWWRVCLLVALPEMDFSTTYHP